MQLRRVDMHFCRGGSIEPSALLPCFTPRSYSCIALTKSHQEEPGPMARSHPVDVHVGARMRQRRTLLGMSQEKLGTAVGLTFQQIQKYERGSNRIGSSPLLEFSKMVGAPVAYLFDQMPSKPLGRRPVSGRG